MNNIYLKMDYTAQNLIEFAAKDLNFGYGISIILFSMTLKFFLSPIIFKLQINSLKLKNIEGDINDIKEKYKSKNDMNLKLKNSKMMKEINQLKKREGISNMLPILSLLQIPLYLTCFFCVRHMTSYPEMFPEMKTQGILWIQDLTQSDPYFIFPLILVISNYLNITFSLSQNKVSLPGIISKYKNFIRLMPIFGFPILLYFPSGLNIYWIIISISQFLISKLIHSKPVVRYYFSIKKKKLNIKYADFSENKLDSGSEKLKIYKNKPKKKIN